uniref:Uncharacterized LOC100178500 n=1 Tax=Ciona intestinalis TaxID=7719 RepID=F6PPH9_CIOIN|nr:uncharacterized protein LOC100178500 [Ciona intestinalis]|eukprot:XP_002128951.1 uncharacterized protein LOC100178500 [Ciona intestinalis]
MSEGCQLKESSALAKARELNRTNEKRLSENLLSMSHDVEKKLEKLKIDGQATLNFLQRLKSSTGITNMGVKMKKEENRHIKMLIQPPRKMSFAPVDYKKKKLEETSQRLIVSSVSPACEGNPVPVRTVHPWTTNAARVLSRKKPPQIPRPTGRRRHSIDSDDISSDDDDVGVLLVGKKKGRDSKKHKASSRRLSLPPIRENRRKESTDDDNDVTSIQASLVKLKQRRKSVNC